MKNCAHLAQYLAQYFQNCAHLAQYLAQYIQNCAHLAQYLAQYFSEREIFQPKSCTENRNTNFIFSNFFENRVVF
jgi:GTPase Era involved in 16S rRNA processing